jgi:phosphonate transport system substrate-binding protein
MGSGNAHIGWLPPLAYMLAKEKGYANVGLVVLRNGADHYGVQFVANSASGFTPYFDTATNTTTADAATALAQFADKKPCWTDPLSASGYVIPAGLLASNGVKIKSAAFVIGHPTVIQALYAGGICDFGATYIDARTDKKFAEVPDVTEKVAVIWVSDPFIPNDNVSYAADLPAEFVEKVTAALVELSGTEEGTTLLKDVGYQVQGLRPVDDTFYDEFRVNLQASGLDVTTLVK